MDGRRLEVVNCFNYLGVILDTHLSFKQQCKKINLAQVRLNQLHDIRKNTDQETTALVYFQMVRPIMEYCPFIIDGGPAWINPKLQVLQNTGLRICSNIRDALTTYTESTNWKGYMLGGTTNYSS